MSLLCGLESGRKIRATKTRKAALEWERKWWQLMSKFFVLGLDLSFSVDVFSREVYGLNILWFWFSSFIMRGTFAQKSPNFLIYFPSASINIWAQRESFLSGWQKKIASVILWATKNLIFAFLLAGFALIFCGKRHSAYRIREFIDWTIEALHLLTFQRCFCTTRSSGS